jgi:PST family polysaccharide transporter
MAGISLGVAVPVSLLSSWIILILYGPEFSGAGAILALHIWAGVPVTMGLAANTWMINQGLTNLMLQQTVLGAVVNVALNLWLIPRYGGVGAAIATLAAYMCATVLWYILDPRTRRIGWMQLRAFLLFV